MKYKNKKGFTLAELLIVVAIIAVLVAVAIPIFSSQLEKARQAVDLQNARAIQSALTNAYSTGEIDFGTKANETHGYGVWVLICRDKNSKPQGYDTAELQYNDSLFCGANSGVWVKGVLTGDDMVYDTNVEVLLKESGINVESLKIRCKDSSNGKGWDWIVIQIGRYKDGTIESRIYSGFKGWSSSFQINQSGNTNIEKIISGK